MEDKDPAKDTGADTVAEGTYKVSESGRATDLDGKAVQILGVESVKDGSMVLKTDRGAMAAGEVQYATAEEAAIYEAVAGTNASPAAAWEMINAYKASDGVSAGVYATAMPLAYLYGKLGYEKGVFGEDSKLGLTLEQRKTAWKTGRNDAAAEVKKTKNAGTESTVSDQNAGKKIIFEGFKYNKKKASDVQKASMAGIEIISKLSNLEIHVYKSVERDGKLYAVVGGKERLAPNGYFTAGNKIYIDINAGDGGEGVMLYTLSHEIGHYIAEWNAADFKAISDFLFAHYAGDVPVYDLLEQQKEKLIDSYQQDGKEIPGEAALEKAAREELVCDMLSEMLADKQAYDRLMELKKQDLNVFQRLGEAIKQVLDKLAQFIGIYDSKNPDFGYAASEETFGEETFRQLQDLYLKAFVQADANYQAAAEKNTIQEDGEVMYMSRDIDSVTEDTVREDLTDIFNGKNVTASSYIPLAKTTPFAVRYITGYMTDRPIIVDKKKAYFDMREDGIFKEDSSHHYHGMGIDGFLDAMDILNDPEYAIREEMKNGDVHFAFISTNEDGYEVCLAFQMDVYKPEYMMNGYPDGYYNIDITEFVATDEWLEAHGVEPGTSYVDHLLSFGQNSLAYDRRFHLEQLEKARAKELEKARNTDVGSAGLAASHINNRASSDTVTQPGAIVKNESLDNTDVEIDTKTESVAPAVVMSERTWKQSDYVQEREKAAREIARATGVSVKKAKAYIDSVNSIAKMIAEDRVRLDYFSSPNRSSFVSNVEYGGSFDFSTLCKKRRLLTGTFTAIQKALPNTALTANEILDIRNRMKDAGLEVSCGLCYVEGSRANMGQFAKEFLKLYKQYYPDAWQPNMADVNTPDGIEWMRINHPECYEQYEYFWNHYGTLKPGDKNLFASQQKPKLYQLHTEYKGEILQKFTDDENVEEKNLNGGIRLQSFSDFEIVHLIDTMQIIMDMSRVGLAGQAYTKVPDFAWALGDTGLKINLSLIAKGVDENGKLIFDDVEGMPIDQAMALRERYSRNVGTILVAFNDEQLLAAMADERVDFIIPFHRSQWKKSQYEAMGLPAKTKDYTYMQNEKFIKPQYHEYRGKMVRDKATNYMPNEYWDFSKSGKENAEAYLEMCAKNNKRPKFYKLLENNGDGSYSLKADGSTDGYWKLLIDFKMYDNTGKGSPQMPVKPDFNMDEATRMLEEYRGGHSDFPVAQGVVDGFVEEYKQNHGDVVYSSRNLTKYDERSTNGFKDYDIVSAVYNIRSEKAKRGHDLVRIGTMPSVYRRLFGLSGDVYVSNEHLYQNMVSRKTAEAEGRFNVDASADYHNLGEEKIINAIEQFQDPLVIMESLKDFNEPRLVAILEEKGNDGQNLIAVMELYAPIAYPGRNQRRNHVLITIYEKNSLPDYIEKTGNNNRILHIKEGFQQVRQADLQLVGAVSKETLANNVARFNKKVKAFKERNKITYQERSGESVSNRVLLANALESVAQDDVELGKIRDYRRGLENIRAQEEKLAQLEAKRKALADEGKRKTEEYRQVQIELRKTENRISTYDQQLLRLEASKPLQRVLTRERAAARERAKQKGKEALEAYKAKAEARQQKAAQEHREMAAAMRTVKADTALMEKEFVRLLKMYEKQLARSEKQADRDQQALAELKAAFVAEAKSHKADQALWEKEFERLSKAFDKSDRDIAKLEQKLQQQRESAKKKVEDRKRTAVRHKIQAFKEKMQGMLLRPSDRQYVPINLTKAMVEVCELIDTDSDLYKKDGSVNKAQQRREETKEKLQALKDEYEKLKDHSDPMYSGEFDEMVYVFYRVQCGAFRELKNAEALRNKLRSQGYSDAFIVEVERT